MSTILIIAGVLAAVYLFAAIAFYYGCRKLPP